MRHFFVLGLAVLALGACGDRHVMKTTSKTPALDVTLLEREMTSLAGRAAPGVLGVGVVNLENSSTYLFNGDRRFPMQSVFKAPLAAAALAEIDGGRLRFDEVVTLRDQDISPPFSPIGAAYPGRRDYTVAELISAAAGASDNTAADVLMKRIGGPGTVTAWLQAQRITDLRIDRYERQLQPELSGMISFRPEWKDPGAYAAALNAVPAQARRAATAAYMRDPQDTATPRAMLDFLQKLEAGELLSAPSTKRLLQIMTQTQSGPARLKAGLPQGARLAHKTGSARTDLGLNPAVNDVGVVTLPDGRRYAVAVFLSGSTLDEAARDALIADVARVAIKGMD